MADHRCPQLSGTGSIEALHKQFSTVDVQPTHTNTTASKKRQRLVEQLLAGESLRIAFINDNGFYAGAGIAMARQARSFALAGHQVSVLALNGYPQAVLARHRYGRWILGEQVPHPLRGAPHGGLPTDRSGALNSSHWILDQQKNRQLGSGHSRQSPFLQHQPALSQTPVGCRHPTCVVCP